MKMNAVISLVRRLVRPLNAELRPDWWAYFGSFGDDIIGDD